MDMSSSYPMPQSQFPTMQPMATAPSAYPIPQPGMPQLGMPQPGMPQLGMPQPGMPQLGMPQPGIPQPGMPQLGMPQPGMPQPGIPPSGMLQPGIPMTPQGGWLPPNTNCPPGLEYLIVLDHLFVRQKVELIEAFTRWETKNKYLVVNIGGETVFYVAKQSGICARFCMGRYRSCEFYVMDSNQREVLRMVRPCRCDSCCCPCCLQELEVYSGDTLLGSISQNWSLWRPSFSVRDASGETVLIIKGPWIQFCMDVKFKVKSADGVHRVGEIKKEWCGTAREYFTYSNNFGISFPLDLDVKIKSVLLGACLLIDFMYFEEN
ncbi:PREDICTED: phospholipid scramblase 2-like isoform X2 [Eufriesea mexicana]|uniref:phospholipid scramblase 2-like isoform X2 n=1 Tax=Eufriesea mexicana TaxID=516756 RepID=UPI00083BC1BC|nr:PREDICTED: phospholipid scramblase 2-like isoform X2 [Eufriesea mexicana]